MLELLTVIGLMLVAATMLKRQRPNSKGDRAEANGPSAGTPKLPSRQLTLRQAGEGGVQAVPRDGRFAFVAGFGVRPEQLKELHIYAVAGSLEQFPQKVRELLGRLYANGFAVGEDIMALLHHGRPLKEGEAIYVAVARDERADTTRTVAFLDRRRAC